MAQNDHAADVEPGDKVTWTYGTGTLGSGRASGEVLQTDLSKFGYDDIIRVANQNGQTNYIRPIDLV